MHPAPAISVILPAYNVEDYIAQAARSILAQTFTDFELIIIDDASTDQTPAKLRALDSKRVKIITNAQNLGLTKSLNLGIAAARGKYIARQDGDDLSLPTRLAEQFAYMESHPEIALLGTARLRLSAEGKINHRSGRLLVTRPPAATAADGKTTRPTFDDLLNANHFVHGSVMFRKSVFDEVGGYNEIFRFHQDYNLWLRIVRRFQTANLIEPLYALRSHAASVTQMNAPTATLCHFLAKNMAKDAIDDATIADIQTHGIERYYRHLAPDDKIRYHRKLANTFYRSKQWHNALREYRRVKELGGATLQARARMLRLRFISE